MMIHAALESLRCENSLGRLTQLQKPDSSHSPFRSPFSFYLDLDTPAPITPGSFSSPTLNSMPMAR